LRAIPEVGIGTGTLHGEAARDTVRGALEVGYRHVDTARGYENEREVGRALAESGLPRDDVFLTTKLSERHSADPLATLSASLADLGVAQVDLWLVHWPPQALPAVDIWRAMVVALRRQQVKAIGVSNFSLPQIDELIEATGVAPAVNQIAWTPHTYSAATLAAHRSRGVTLMSYSPLRGTDLQHPVLWRIAERSGLSPAQVVLSWNARHGVPVVTRTSRRQRLLDNLDAARYPLGDADVRAIDAITDPSTVG